MADPKVPARQNASLPSFLTEVMNSDMTPAGNHWLGFQRDVLANNTAVVNNSSSYNLARARQTDSVVSVLDSRIRLARKYAEVLDVPHLLSEDQRQREHARALSENRRVLENVNAVHELHLAAARHDLELAKIKEQGVRAQRNFEAAQRVKDVEIDRWYAEASARGNNATAELHDTVADLTRTQTVAPPDGTAKQRAADLAVIDHQIELERQRSNDAGVLVLLNLRARLQASP